MPRGRRRTLDVTALEQELDELRKRQLALRQQLRRMRGSGREIGKLQEKLEKQLGIAKWTIEQIKELQPDWDDLGFYQSVKPRQPAPRGRRPRAAKQAA